MNRHHFVICVDNTDYEASLERRKVYESVPSANDERQGLLRVVDESGEDYLFPIDRFVPIDLPRKVEQELLKSP
jgi:hypothetical protein